MDEQKSEHMSISVCQFEFTEYDQGGVDLMVFLSQTYFR